MVYDQDRLMIKITNPHRLFAAQTQHPLQVDAVEVPSLSYRHPLAATRRVEPTRPTICLLNPGLFAPLRLGVPQKTRPIRISSQDAKAPSLKLSTQHSKLTT